MAALIDAPLCDKCNHKHKEVRLRGGGRPRGVIAVSSPLGAQTDRCRVCGHIGRGVIFPGPAVRAPARSATHRTHNLPLPPPTCTNAYAGRPAAAAHAAAGAVQPGGCGNGSLRPAPLPPRPADAVQSVHQGAEDAGGNDGGGGVAAANGASGAGRTRLLLPARAGHQ